MPRSLAMRGLPDPVSLQGFGCLLGRRHEEGLGDRWLVTLFLQCSHQVTVKNESTSTLICSIHVSAAAIVLEFKTLLQGLYSASLARIGAVGHPAKIPCVA